MTDALASTSGLPDLRTPGPPDSRTSGLFAERWLNPILLRSLRQALRSRAFIGIYLIVLAAAGLAAVIAAVVGIGRESTSGSGLFLAAVMAWTFAAWLMIPVQTFNAVTRERNEDTWDLVQLTGISPYRVVIGLVATALVQSSVIGAALAPFLILGYLLRGVDLGMLVLALVVLPLGTLVCSSLAVFLGCLGNHRALRSTLSSLNALGLTILCFGMLTFWGYAAERLVRSLAQDREAWMGLAIFANGAVAAATVLAVLAATMLTHPAQNRSTAGRLVWWGVWLNGLVWVVVSATWIGGFSAGTWGVVLFETLHGFVIFALVWSLVLGIFATTEPDGLTNRQRQSLSTGRPWWQFALRVLGPGACRGRRCTLLMVSATLALLALGGADARFEQSERRMIVLSCYGLFLVGVVEPLLRRFAGGILNNAAKRRAGLLVTGALWACVPSILVAVAFRDDQGVVVGLSPVLATIVLSENLDQWTSVGVIAALFGLAGFGGLLWGCRAGTEDELILVTDRSRGDG